MAKITGGFTHGGEMDFTVSGKRYRVRINPHYTAWKENPFNPDTGLGTAGPQDQWRYILPNGETYSHPTKEGALWHCFKDFVASVGEA